MLFLFSEFSLSLSYISRFIYLLIICLTRYLSALPSFPTSLSPHTSLPGSVNSSTLPFSSFHSFLFLSSVFFLSFSFSLLLSVTISFLVSFILLSIYLPIPSPLPPSQDKGRAIPSLSYCWKFPTCKIIIFIIFLSPISIIS